MPFKWNFGLRARREDDVEVSVSEHAGVRSLHLGSDTVQSSMKIDDPYELVLSYTRAMMAFLLFHPEPRRVLMIGLGGGSLAKFVHRHFPRAAVTVVENEPRVIAVARQYFCLPEDERLVVREAEGAAWVAAHPDSCDVLMVDGYDGIEQSAALCSADFYASAGAALAADGVLVANLWSSDARFDACLQRIEGVFEAVACVPAERRGNVAAIAMRCSPGQPRWDDLRARARTLQVRYGLEFLKFVDGLREMNPRSAARLLV
ncbi:MAG TPA: polyamine aminopropyltransferase [Burkholderiales bacterium]|nr:polyamine aminopropyltransferase [Burkholderiales bacterium]